MKLVQEGRLSLDDKAFSILNISPPPGMNVRDKRIFNITIRDLLDHSGGWDRSQPPYLDPAFDDLQIARFLEISPPPTSDQIIEYMLAQPLQFTPGTKYAYSNFGFIVLGRVIEKITGESYEDYIRTNVLAPMGITDMHIGHALLLDAFPNEVHYYDYEPSRTCQSIFDFDYTDQVPCQYDFNMNAIDSAGGWIASAIDLVKFALSVDGARPPAFLQPDTVRTMLACPPPPLLENCGSGWTALGWDVDNSTGFLTWSHSGGLDPGTTTLLVRAGVYGASGVSWAVLFNTNFGYTASSDSNPLQQRFFSDVDNWLWKDFYPVNFPPNSQPPSWPTWNLFNDTAFNSTATTSMQQTTSSQCTAFNILMCGATSSTTASVSQTPASVYSGQFALVLRGLLSTTIGNVLLVGVAVAIVVGMAIVIQPWIKRSRGNSHKT
jgi:CubicO group peptidase (beta-lactamase class C family)